ncbi:hypothetical protein [Sphingomonas sp. M1-B02]|uniref:hypothetical protein n=1 Tax=Sphingomonas sp. M1-B02 TaxID=3114300 RepID=UPI00224066D2|nr:hypothetical protein [Sphingomonas sp. S6-11]UZK67776.1 hypothetical protein OKW87_08095 [Sphingomonas sp. S6-11]
MSGTDTIERALDLARNSSCRNVQEIIRTLTIEGHSGVEMHLAGQTIRKQLKTLIARR